MFKSAVAGFYNITCNPPFGQRGCIFFSILHFQSIGCLCINMQQNFGSSHITLKPQQQSIFFLRRIHHQQRIVLQSLCFYRISSSRKRNSSFVAAIFNIFHLHQSIFFIKQRNFSCFQTSSIGSYKYFIAIKSYIFFGLVIKIAIILIFQSNQAIFTRGYVQQMKSIGGLCKGIIKRSL